MHKTSWGDVRPDSSPQYIRYFFYTSHAKYIVAGPPTLPLATFFIILPFSFPTCVSFSFYLVPLLLLSSSVLVLPFEKHGDARTGMQQWRWDELEWWPSN